MIFAIYKIVMFFNVVAIAIVLFNAEASMINWINLLGCILFGHLIDKKEW